MHLLNGYINGYLEYRKPDSVWAEWVPNTFPFYNLAPESRFWFVDSALSFPFLDCNLGNKVIIFLFLDCNLGNKAL